MLGARSAVVEKLELLFWKRINEGTYRARGGARATRYAYTRVLVGKITLKNNVGYMGTEQVVMVVHFHYLVANKHVGFRKKQTTHFGHG